MTDVTDEETATVEAAEPAANCSSEDGLDAIDEQLIDRLASRLARVGCSCPARVVCCRR
jgi:hypothetical protein